MISEIGSGAVSLSSNSGFIAEHDRTLGLRCHDRHFRDAVVCDENGTKIFDLKAKDIGTSWTLRRGLFDSQGCHVLDLRHTKMSYKTWILEDHRGNEFCKIKDVTSTSGFTAVDVEVLSGGSDTSSIQIRSFDKAGSRTTFQVDGATIVEMTLTDNNDASFLHKRGLDRTTWKLQVVKGVDIALIVALAFARAEIMHAWRR